MSIDPVTMMAAGTALSAGGSLLGSQNSQDRVGAVRAGRDRVLQEEINRQNQYSAEAQPIFTGQLGLSSAGSEASQRETAIKARDASVVANQGQPALTMGGMGDQGSTEYQRQVANLGQIVADNAKRANVLASYGDVAADNSRSFRKASDKIGTISNFSAGSANVLPAEYSSSDANAYASHPPSPFADLLKAAGTGAAMIGSFSSPKAPFASIDELMKKRGIG